MSEEVHREIRPLNAEELAARDAAIPLVRSSLSGVGGRLPEHLDRSALPELQKLYNVLAARDEKREDVSIALGVAFAFVFESTGEFEWVRVTDEFGSESCLAIPGKEIWISPISMIVKRVDRGDDVDLAQLFDTALVEVRRMAASADYRKR